MEYPSFVDIEYSSPDEGGYPTSICWSLPNGQIKSVIICPDDDWEPWDNTDGTVDIQHLFDQGVSGPDLIRELNDDLDGTTVFTDGLDDDESLLELLYETYHQELSFELASSTQLFSQLDLEEILVQRNDLALAQQLDLDQLEDKVRSLIFMYHNLNGG